MLAIGHSSLWLNDQNMSDISEGPLELELDQGDVPPPGTSDIREGPFEPKLGQDDAPPPETSSTSHRTATIGRCHYQANTHGSAIKPQAQDPTIRTEPRRCATPTRPDQEVTQLLFTPEALFDKQL